MSGTQSPRCACRSSFPHRIHARWLAAACFAGVMFGALGCEKPEPIIAYTIPTKVPAQFAAKKQRMLAAMCANESETWFFKVSGPENAVGTIEKPFKEFVQSIKFVNGSPKLKPLPEGWKQSGTKKRMRYASILVETEEKQLDISVSQLGLQDDWDSWVSINVNRWRGQLGLEDSDEKWAGAEAIEIPGADGPSVWTDIVGEPDAAQPMSPPFAGMGGMPMAPTQSAAPESKVDFERPEGWRDGKKSSMRLASFNVGPEDAPAEVTVIPAGGGLRDNVNRWLGQVRGEEEVSDEVLDAVFDASEKIQVNGFDGQRFLLTNEDPTQGNAIDATIVPLESGSSMFIKMTGPAKTVADHREALTTFLQTLKF